jgi:hypothetical protein
LKTFSAICCLLLVAAVLFWPVIFQGKVIVPGDTPNSNPFLFIGQTVPPAPLNTLLSDEIEQFYVWHRVAAQALQSDGHLPLWNPYIFTGQPLLANAQSSLFYPPNLLLRLFSPGKVATLRVFFNLLIAGLFTFLFCRELKLSHKGALLAALSFAFSGPVVVWIGFPLCNVLVCLPFLMWAGERLIREKSLPRAALLGVGMGVCLLGGHPETTFQVLAISALYFLARVAWQERALKDKGALVGAFALAVVIGALVSGIQLLPFLDFMRESATFARGGRASDVGGSLFYSREWLANLASAVTLVCPNFFGNPLDHSYVWPFKSFQNYNEQAVYFGVVPLALAACAPFAREKRRPLIVICVLALVCLGVAWHLPLFEAINHLPVFSMAPGKRMRLPFVFLAAVLAGFGYDGVVDALKSGGRDRKRLYAGAAVLLVTVLLLMCMVVWKQSAASELPAGTFWYKILHTVFAYSQWRSYLPALVALSAGLCFVACRRSPRLSGMFPALLLVLTAFELCALGWGYNPTVRESEILPAAPAVEFLQKREREPYRILTTDGYFYPNYGAVYGICDVAGYDAPVYQSSSDIYLAQGGPSVGGQIDSRQQWDPNWPLVDFLNVRYVISPRDLPPDKFKMLYENKYYALYENLHAQPRAFLVYDSEQVTDRKAMLARMLGKKVDLGKTVLLEEAIPLGMAGAAGSAAPGSVQLAKFSADEVVWRVASDRAGMLVMSDLFTPDWSARVDGRPARLYRANYAYRAVCVPQGKHTVTFEYAPVSYRVGAAMTWAGLVLVAAIGVLGLLRRRKES